MPSLIGKWFWPTASKTWTRGYNFCLNITNETYPKTLGICCSNFRWWLRMTCPIMTKKVLGPCWLMTLLNMPNRSWIKPNLTLLFFFFVYKFCFFFSFNWTHWTKKKDNQIYLFDFKLLLFFVSYSNFVNRTFFFVVKLLFHVTKSKCNFVETWKFLKFFLANLKFVKELGHY